MSNSSLPVEVTGWEPHIDNPSPRVYIDFEASKPTREYVLDSTTGTRSFHSHPSPSRFLAGSSNHQPYDVSLPESPLDSPIPDAPPGFSRPVSRASSFESKFETSATVIPGTGRKGEPGHVPRPPNRWILFRQHEVGLIPRDAHWTKAEINTHLQHKWKHLTREEHMFWVEQYELNKKEHYDKYPMYVYRPRPRRGRVRRARGNSRDTTTRRRPRRSLTPSRPSKLESLDSALPTGACEPLTRSTTPPVVTVPLSSDSEQARLAIRRLKRRSASVPDMWFSSFSSIGDTHSMTWSDQVPSSSNSEAFQVPSPSTLSSEGGGLVLGPLQLVAQFTQQASHTMPSRSSQLPAYFPPYLPNFQSRDSSLAGALGPSDPPTLPRLNTAFPLPFPQSPYEHPQSAPAYTTDIMWKQDMSLDALKDFDLGLSRDNEYFDFAACVPGKLLHEQRSMDDLWVTPQIQEYYDNVQVWKGG